MAEITIDSPALESDPGRSAIEGAIRDTLKDYAGVWTVMIRPARMDPWWVVRMERSDGDFKNTLLVDLRAQDPSALRHSLQESLKGAA